MDEWKKLDQLNVWLPDWRVQVYRRRSEEDVMSFQSVILPIHLKGVLLNRYRTMLTRGPTEEMMATERHRHQQAGHNVYSMQKKRIGR
jgi:hypothetical protein